MQRADPALPVIDPVEGAAGGATFWLSCLIQRAKDHEVIYEEQRPSGSTPTVRRGRFQDALGAWETARPDRPIWLCDEDLISADFLDEVGEDHGIAFLATTATRTAPPSPAALCLASANARTTWRRDPLCWSTKLLLLHGSVHVRLVPSEPEGAFVGAWGAAVAAESALMEPQWVELTAGQRLSIPAGWWYSISCGREKMWGLQMQSLLSHPDPSESLLQTGTPGMPLTSMPSEHHQLRRCLPGLFPLPTKRRATLCTSDQKEAEGTGRLLEVMWKLSVVYPEFVLAGVGLPWDSFLWSSESLELFVCTRGFWRPWPSTSCTASSGAPVQLLSELSLPGPHVELRSGGMPRIIWMFWAQEDGLGGFRRACIRSWVCKNPTWQVVLLNTETCLSYLDPTELPRPWGARPSRCRRPTVLADAVRLALLKRHGGVYVDVSVVCCRSLDNWLMKSLGQHEMAAFYYKNFGRSDRINTGEYVENWFLACLQGSQLMRRWHEAFQLFWTDRADAHDYGGLRNSQMFKHTDLSCMTEDQTNYLTMHCCFKWLIDSDAFARKLWQTSTLLIAADTALGWILDLPGLRENWSISTITGHHAAHWLYRDDLAWVAKLVRLSPMLKFVGAHASVFDQQPEAELMRKGTCMQFLLSHALQPDVMDVMNLDELHFEAVD
ncbi:unnamed protein product [Durusdinium trenchii]|uniref:JmjC domain-containing protein n=1 Tax=Durusdinium trenchii TaxID=1381693 RepID=A0ABP0KW74_9DINO